MSYAALLKHAIIAAVEAGEEVLKIYETPFGVETKSDNTPVTLADKLSGARIAEVLSETSIPMISEEDEVAPFCDRQLWDKVWIIDPLDGTKEFIKRNGEFAINIALTENGKPVIGVIYAPVLQELYFASLQNGSFKMKSDQIRKIISTGLLDVSPETIAEKLPARRLNNIYTLVASRSHLSREINEHVHRLENVYGAVNIINVGSSIKQCWVAEGRANEYARFGTTMEWDTAAGQCILEEAGGSLIDLETNLPMRYNKANLQNNYFIAKHHGR